MQIRSKKWIVTRVITTENEIEVDLEEPGTGNEAIRAAHAEPEGAWSDPTTKEVTIFAEEREQY